MLLQAIYKYDSKLTEHVWQFSCDEMFVECNENESINCLNAVLAAINTYIPCLKQEVHFHAGIFTLNSKQYTEDMKTKFDELKRSVQIMNSNQNFNKEEQKKISKIDEDLLVGLLKKVKPNSNIKPENLFFVREMENEVEFKHVPAKLKTMAVAHYFNNKDDLYNVKKYSL